MSAQAWFDSQHHEVTPGGSVVAVLHVRNIGVEPDTFAITPSGMAAAYTTVATPIITLFGGETTAVEVEIRPPRLPTTTAGPVSLSVRIVPHDDPDRTAHAETGIDVLAFDECRIGLLQPVLRSRRRAVFELAVENGGNTTTSLQLRFVDQSGRTDGHCEPPSVVIEPGTTALAHVRVRVHQAHLERSARSMGFRVDALDRGEHVVSAHGTLVQAPLLPERLSFSVGSVIAALLLVALGWMGIVKPAIREAAEQAVGDLPTTTLAPITTSSGQTPSGGSGAGGGEIVNVQLPVVVEVGQTLANSYAVPGGRTLQVTDIVIQNPQLDLGTLVVARDDEVLLTYNLGNVFSDIAVPFVTPLLFGPGSSVNVTVTCTGLGDATVASCSPDVLVSGTLVG